MEIVNRVGIRENGEIWEFINEVALEDFLWDNLELLFGLTPLKRQLNISGQICDILALDQNRSLVILELKNTEDRYILQQLTRYYDAVIREKPLADQVNYKQQVRLIAIKPKFHKVNHTDREYSQLPFEFWQFSIVKNNRSLFFELTNYDSQEIKQVEIPYLLKEEDQNILPLPRNLSKALAQCSLEQQAEILRIRDKILTFDKRMQEFSTAGNVKYGNGNTKSSKFCAEFYIDKGEILIFLWLPLKNGTSEKMIGRARLWTDWQDKTLVEGYVNSGVGTDINNLNRLIDNLVNKITCCNSNFTGRSFIFYCPDKIPFPICINVSTAQGKKVVEIIKSLSKRIYQSDIITIATSKEIELLTLLISIEEPENVKVLDLKINIQSVYKSLDYFVDIALERWSSRI
jgi:RecB family endonuclease NucS